MISFEIWIAVISVSFIVGFMGVILILWNKKLDERNLHWGIGFAAGVLIGIAILEIIPTAISLSDSDIMIYTLIGFLGFFILEKRILIHHFDRKESETEGSPFHFSVITFVAFSFHALLDGFVIGLGLEFSEKFGLIIFIAIVLHKLPLTVSIASVFFQYF